MTKAINWPAQFMEEVLSEDSVSTKVAVRLGSLYYDHCYYFPGEVVDIRVDHKIVRQGEIVLEMKLCKIQDLSDSDFEMLKKSLTDKTSLISFLASNYEQSVSEETLVTVIYYMNKPIEPKEKAIDDPHL